MFMFFIQNSATLSLIWYCFLSTIPYTVSHIHALISSNHFLITVFSNLDSLNSTHLSLPQKNSFGRLLLLHYHDQNEALSVRLSLIQSHENYLTDFNEILHKNGRYTWSTSASMSLSISRFW